MKRNFRVQEAKTRRQLAMVSSNDVFMNGILFSLNNLPTEEL